MPAKAPFQDPMVPVNDDEIIEVATEQAVIDAEIANIPGVDTVNENINIPGVDPMNNNKQRLLRATTGHWQ